MSKAESEHGNDSSIPSKLLRHPWDVAVVYSSVDRMSDNDAVGCGHLIGWKRFQEPPAACPVCNAPILLVTDQLSNDTTKVLFKYNKQTYWLTVANNPKRSWLDFYERKCTAQERIAYALGMNVKQGIKILCKGKVLYPSYGNQHDENDVSRTLLEISQHDWLHHPNKASLVVMGTRQGQGLHEPRQGLFAAIIGLVVTMVLKIVHVVWGSAQMLVSYVVRPALPSSDEEQRRQRDE